MCDCLTLQPPNWKEGYELPEDVHLEAMDAFEITDAVGGQSTNRSPAMLCACCLAKDGFYESVKVFRGDLYLGQVVGGDVSVRRGCVWAILSASACRRMVLGRKAIRDLAISLPVRPVP